MIIAESIQDTSDTFELIEMIHEAEMKQMTKVQILTEEVEMKKNMGDRIAAAKAKVELEHAIKGH